MVAALAPDVVFRSDAAAAALSFAPAWIEGADAVAEAFSGRARAAQVALVDGSLGVVVAPGGRLLAILEVAVEDGRIVAIDAVADPDRLGHAAIDLLDD